MLYRSLFPRQFFPDLERLQRELQSAIDPSPGIRGTGLRGYPALNVGSTPTSVEVYAFAPGMDPASIDVQLERGVLTIAGERKADIPQAEGQAPAGNKETTVHMDERFAGRFRRVVSLPDDVDPNSVDARYRNGVLHVSVKRRESSLPRRVTVQ